MTLARSWGFVLLFSTLLVFSFQNCAQTDGTHLDTVSKNCADENCLEGSPVIKSCTFNGEDVKDGDAIDAYLASASSTCEHERRICSDGNLSGSYQFPTCSVNPNAKKSCLFDGKVVAHGAVVQAYLSSSVASGLSCSGQQRTCSDGVLSGSYTYPSCAVNGPESCSFDGKTLAHGAKVKAFLHSSSASSQQLCDFSETRSCVNGRLLGSYTYSSCTVNQPRSCTFNGRTIPHGGSVRAYLNSSSDFGKPSCEASQNRICTDGALSGTYQYGSCTVGAPEACLFDGKMIPHGGSVLAFRDSSAAFGSSNCSFSETRSCHNGYLRGSYEFSSCKVAAAKSCLFDGRTIAHGGTVTGYASSTGLKGDVGACAPLTRSCNNGALSNPTALYASCTVNEPRSCLFKNRTIPHKGKVYAYTKATNNGVGKCDLQERICQDGTLSGTATFDSCVRKCKYGKFEIDDSQVILYRMDGARGECGDNPVRDACRVAQPALQIGSFVGDKTVWGGYLAALTCADDGEGRVASYRLLVKNSTAGMCGNPLMSTPIKVNTLVHPDGSNYSRAGGSILIQNVDRTNSKLIWAKPYRLKESLPR